MVTGQCPFTERGIARRVRALNRSELRTLAEERVLEAEALLKAERWSGAYYLIGYAVECGLKACILAHVEATGAIFQDRRYSEKCWTHDVEALVTLADLKKARKRDASLHKDLGVNWNVVKDWNEGARYLIWTEKDARRLFQAVTDTTNGVLPWIRVRW